MGKRFEVLSSKPLTAVDELLQVSGADAYRMGHFDTLEGATGFRDVIRSAWPHQDARVWVVDRGPEATNPPLVLYDSAAPLEQRG